MPLNQFCGTYSLDPWSKNSFGLCFLELYLYIPVCILYLLFTIVYILIHRRHAAFEAFQSSLFWVRIVITMCIICNSTVWTVLSFVLPFKDLSLSSNEGFEIVHSTSIILLWVIVLVHDFCHGKSTYSSSRGPASHLIASFIYLYLYGMVVWSAYYQITDTGKFSAMTFRMIHLSLVSLHLISKAPIIYNTEVPRRKAARLARLRGNPTESIQVNMNESMDNSPLLPVESGGKNEDAASWFSKVFFCWVNPIIVAGYYGELDDVSKLPELPDRLNTSVLESALPLEVDNLKNIDSSSSLKSAWPLIRAIWKPFGREFMILGIIKFFISAGSLSTPIFLNHFILGLSSASTSIVSCVIWGVLVICVNSIVSIVDTNYSYQMSTFGYKIRVAVSGLVYRRMLSVRLASLHTLGSGSVLNYFTTDSDRVVNLARSVHELWAMPVQLILTIVLLYQHLGVSCLVGVGFLILLLPANRLLVLQMRKYAKRLMHYKDLRIKLMTEILPHMAAVKLACWERLMRSKVAETRSQELRALWGQKMLDAACVFCWAACPALLTSCTFAVYIALGNTLDASTVFTSLALFSMLIGPMNAFPWVMNGVVEAAISAQRISKLLAIPRGPFPIRDTHTNLQELVSSGVQSFKWPKLLPPVDLRRGSFTWSDTNESVLSAVSLLLQKGELVGVVGPVGSGKSSLLLAILGELFPTHTVSRLSISVHEQAGTGGTVPRLRYAYVGQKPWLFAGSVCENIVFGSFHDSEWLDQVIDACGLRPDVINFPDGLETFVGEAGGNRLSGGQRARVALARAVYQRADVYLLDDPLAALDVHVGEHVVKHCFFGLLAGKTRIITSHQADWMTNEECDPQGTSANLILELQNGKIDRRYAPNSKSIPTDTPRRSISSMGESGTDQPMLNPHGGGGGTDDATAGKSQTPDWEQIAFGSISSHVYASYFRAVGYVLALSIIVALIVMQATRNGADWWLSFWVSESTGPNSNVVTLSNLSYTGMEPLLLKGLVRSTPNVQMDQLMHSNVSHSFYLYVYGGIVSGHLVATTFRAVLFAIGGLTAAAVVHQDALDAVLQASMSFFDRTPQGRILNRFSADVASVDDALPFVLNILLANVAGLIGVIVITCISLPFLLLLLMPMIFIFWSVQLTYRGASRDLKRITSVTRSPLFTHFADSLTGLVVIRGLGQQVRFRQITVDRLHTQLRAELASLAAGSWLNIRLQLIAATLLTGVVVMALLGRLFGLTEVAAAGLSVAYALNISGLMTGTVYIATESEKNLVSVERCQEITDNTPIESMIIPTSVMAPVPSRRRSSSRRISPPMLFEPVAPELFASWPSEGHVEFRDVSLSYVPLHKDDQTQIQALMSVSFVVEPRQRLGVVGRTGSGKSSLLRVLLRLVDHFAGPNTNRQIAMQAGFVGASGLVLVDGVDIRTIPLTKLRTAILTISQEPFLFSGQLRDNLDPDRSLPDSMLHEALLKCQLATTLPEANTWLYRDVGEAGQGISAGQRQLICLARALLRRPRPKIICLDEATSAIDHKAEATIHDIIEQEFPNTTVILIAHRLSTVRQFCSRAIVMSSGQIMARGNPVKLLADDRIRVELIAAASDTEDKEAEP